MVLLQIMEKITNFQVHIKLTDAINFQLLNKFIKICTYFNNAFVQIERPYKTNEININP